MRQFGELYQHELVAAKVFHSMHDYFRMARSRYRILLPPAHFRPPDAHLVDMVRDRLELLQRWITEVMPRISRTLLIGESAGTHTLLAVHALLQKIGWVPDRVVMSAYAMPKSMMAKVLKL